jgi:hypothetical protein
MRLHHAFVLTAALVACHAPRGAPVLADLDVSLAPLRAWFDDHAAQPRVILLLSPT